MNVLIEIPDYKLEEINGGSPKDVILFVVSMAEEIYDFGRGFYAGLRGK